ncbi:MAG: sugar kinase [Streptosporangiales bacterium]|nr:sugar kinase [Streptosporangiales bacterium]
MQAPSQERRRLVFVGSVLVDLVVRVDELPGRGADILARGAHATPGAGFDVLAAAARHGLPAAFAGRHGDGPFGSRVEESLAAEGIDVLLPATHGDDTGFRVGLVERGGDRTFVTCAGAESRLDTADLAGLRLESTDVVHVSGRDLAQPGAGTAIAGWLRTLPADIAVSLEVGPRHDDVPSDVHTRVLRRCDVVSMPLSATGSLLGTSGVKAAAEALHDYAPRLTAAVFRRGVDGCWAYDAESGSAPVEVPAPPLDPTDGTRMDGTHTGVVLAGLARGLPVATAALRANVAALLGASGRDAADIASAATVDRFLGTRWNGS